MNSLLALIAIAMTWVALLTPTTVYCADTYPVKPVRVVAPFAPGGGGASNIIGTELVARAAPDGYIVHIPYKGITQALIDTVAGATQIMTLSPVGTLAQVKAGRVRALAVTTAQRSNAESLRALPTLRESGVADYEFSSWYGMIGPRGLPAAIIARLNEAAHKGLAQNDLRGKLAAEAAEAAPGTPEQFTALLQQEVQRYTALARKFKLQAI